MTSGANPAPLDEFAAPGAPSLDFVITVCDNAHEDLTGTVRPQLHWSIPDPVRADTDALAAAFTDIANQRAAGTINDEQAKQKYPAGFKTLKPYLRTVAQPK